MNKAYSDPYALIRDKYNCGSIHQYDPKKKQMVVTFTIPIKFQDLEWLENPRSKPVVRKA